MPQFRDVTRLLVCGFKPRSAKAGSKIHKAALSPPDTEQPGRVVCVEELTDDLANHYLAAIHARGAAPATVNNHRVMLLSLWRMAWRKRLVEDQPRDVARMKILRRIPTAWTTAQAARILAECQRQTGMLGDLPAGPW